MRKRKVRPKLVSSGPCADCTSASMSVMAMYANHYDESFQAQNFPPDDHKSEPYLKGVKLPATWKFLCRPVPHHELSVSVRSS